MGRKTILLVEDLESDVFFFRRALSHLEADLDVKVVHNGREAQEYVEGHGRYRDRQYYPFPDLIVCDFKMPLRTGAEFLKWLREQSNFKQLPIVIYSGSVLKQEEELAARLGANLYLRKSGDFGETLQRLRDIVKLIHDASPPQPPAKPET